MPVSCVIPARMGSSRFPGKPLAEINGEEMILHTMRRALLADCFDSIYCATDSERIASLVRSHGYEAVMTGVHLTGSDRVMEAAEKLNLDLVVNLQGDEPLVDLELLQSVSETIQTEPSSWVTASSILDPNDAYNRNVVKVRVEENYACDFLREIPLDKITFWNCHRGIYAYGKEARKEFSRLPPSNPEKEHSIEPLRILGLRPIRVIFSDKESVSVDVPADLLKVEQIIQSNKTLDGVLIDV